jgi:hypothetical protein
MPRQTKCFFQGISALVCSYSWVQFVFTVGLKMGVVEMPVLELEGTALIWATSSIWLGTLCGLGLVAAHWPCTVGSESALLAYRQGLHRCHTLLQVSRYKRHVHRAFKPTAHYTTLPHHSPHSPIYTHTMCRKHEFICRCTHPVTIIMQSPCIPMGTAFMI